jgi:hypothetical protein
MHNFFNSSVTSSCSLSIIDWSIKPESRASGFEAAMCIDNCLAKVLTLSDLSFVSNDTTAASLAIL